MITNQIRTKTSYTIFALVLCLSFLSCFVKKKNDSQSNYLHYGYQNIFPSTLKYDTLEMNFFFEKSISAYIDFDVLTQENGFVCDKGFLNRNSYLNGIFNIDEEYCWFSIDWLNS